MTSLFDERIDRQHTDSLKYDFSEKRGKPAGILPLWVADMDFRTPPAVIEALAERSRHGIFGYSEAGHGYYEALESWYKRHFNWQIQPAWLTKTPGVVFAICAAIRALTRKGDSVMIQQPVYYPFAESIIVNERQLVVNQLAYENGRYRINWNDFEAKITRNKVRLFLLCSPHNPVGRVWTRDELARMGDILLKNNVLVISDEIHADFVYPGNEHQVFAAIRPELLENTLTCTAPTKTFNLAGLQVSNILIANPDIRRRFRQEISRTGYSQLNIMGIVAGRAAYQHGDSWLIELRQYLWANLALLREFLKVRLPGVRLIEPEGTYLAWLDFSRLGLTDRELDRRIVRNCNLWLDAGPMFGAGGEGFQRINIACPRAVLQQALDQLAALNDPELTF